MHPIEYIKRKIYPKKLLTRSVYILLISLVLNFTILTVLLYSNHWDKIRYKLVSLTFSDFYFLNESIRNTNSLEEADKILADASYFSFNMKIIPKEAIIDERFGVKNKTTSLLEQLLQSRYDKNKYKVVMVKKHAFSLKKHISPDYDIYIYYHSKYGWLVNSFSSSLVSSSSVAMLSFVMIALSIFLTIIATIITNRQLMPLKQLARAARNFGKGEEVKDLSIRGASEIRIASLSFNKMKNDIKSYIEQKSLLLGAISHDLKTPITKIKLMIGLEDNIAIKNQLNDQLKLMDNIINSYVSLLSEELLIKETKSTLVYNTIKELAENVQKTLGKKPEIVFKTDKNIRIKAHEPSLIRAFYNLINNAYNHAEKCSIIVEAKKDKKALFIHIDDNGKGITKEDAKQIFLPFFKAEKARTQNQANIGTGLGLAIVKEVVKKHKGKVFYSYNSSLKGARFTVFLPIEE